MDSPGTGCPCQSDAPAASGDNVGSFKTPAGNISYRSGSTGPVDPREGSMRNGALISHAFANAGSWVVPLGAEFIGYQFTIGGDAMAPVVFPRRFQDVRNLTFDSGIYLSEIVDHALIQSGTFNYGYEISLYELGANNQLQQLHSFPFGWVSEFTHQDLSSSRYGAGWWLEDQIVLIERTDGQVSWLEAGYGGFFEKTVPYSFETPLGMFGTLETVDSASPPYFQFTSADGQVLKFDETGAGDYPGQTTWYITERIDADGNSTRYEYEPVGDHKRLIQKRDPFGRTTTIAYDSNGFLDRMVDFAGRITQFTVQDGKLAEVVAPPVPSPTGSGTIEPKLSFGYAGNLLNEVTSPQGGKMRFAYDADSRLVGQTNSDNAQYAFSAMFALPLNASISHIGAPEAMDNELLRAEERNLRGHSVHKTVNEFSQVVMRHVEPDYSASPVRGVATEIASRDVRARLTESVSVLQVEDTDGTLKWVEAITSYRYDGLGLQVLPSSQVQPHLDPNSLPPKIQYGIRNQSLQPSYVFDEIGRKTVFTYNRDGSGPRALKRQHVVGLEDPSYGEADDVVWTYRYTGTADTSVILPSGLLWESRDPLGRITHYRYFDDPNLTNTFGRLKQIVFPDATTLTYNYQFTTQDGYPVTVVSETDHIQRVTTKRYDALGRLIQEDRPNPTGSGPATVTSYRYDANSNLVTEIDAEGNATQYVYDAQNRLTEIRQPDPDDFGPGNNGPLSSPITKFTYDSEGNRRAKIDAEGRISSFQYDAANRMFAAIDPDIDGELAPGRSWWTNPVFRFDVNADGAVNTLDVEQMNDFLAGVPTGSVSVGGLAPPETYAFYADNLNGVGGITQADRPLYFDVNGDFVVNAADVTEVQNALGTPVSGPDYGDSFGRAVTLYTYDPAGNRVSETDALGRKTEFRYDIRSRREKVIEPPVPNPQNNNVLEKPVSRYSFDDASQMVKWTDPLGRSTQYEFDELGRRVMEIGPDVDGVQPVWQSPVRPMDVNTDGKIDAADEALMVDALNPSFHSFDSYFVLDDDGFPLRPYLNSLGPQAGQYPVDVNGDGQLTNVDKEIVITYRTTGFVDPALLDSRPVTEYVYDRAGNLRFVVDAMGSVSEYQYDSRNRRGFTIGERPTGPRRVISPAELDLPLSALTLATQGYPVQQTVYDAVGRIDYVDDFRQNPSLPRRTDYSWNALDQLTSLLLPDADGLPGGNDQPLFQFQYDLLGNRKAATDTEGHTTSYVLDNLYRVFQQIQPQVDNGSGTLAPPITTHHYDATGLERLRVDPLLREFESVYDGAGRLDQQYEPNPVTGLATGTNRAYTRFNYDLVGNRLSQWNGKNETTSWTYDALNRVTLSRDERLYDTHFTNDLAGNLIALTDPNQNTTSWQYDSLNRKYREQNALKESRLFLHDLVGNLVEKTDRRGWVTRYDLDHLYRPSAERWMVDDNVVREFDFSFDLAGNLRSASDPGFSYAYVPDRLDRVDWADAVFPGLSPTVRLDYGYDRMNNRRQVAASLIAGSSTTTDFVTDYGFDALHRVELIKQAGLAGGNQIAAKRVDLDYDLAGQPKGTQRRNGLLLTSPLIVDSVHGFDKAGRIDLLNHRNGLNVNQTLASYTWAWDVANRIDLFTSAYAGDGTVDYDYDPAGQLVLASYANAGPHQLDEDYNYDANGNRLSVVYSDQNAVDLQAYWRLNEASGTAAIDSSGNGLTATLGGTPVWITSGLAPQIHGNPSGLHFDSSGDFLSIANSTPLRVGLGDFSASAWVKLDPGINQDMMIFAHGDPNLVGGKGIEFVYRGSVITKPLTLRVNDAVDYEGIPLPPQQVTYLTQSGLQDGKWHHLGFTLDRDGQIVLYVDGLAVRATTSVKQGDINPTTPFYIGRGTAGPTSFNLRGRIDEVRVYRHAISPADMAHQAQDRDNGSTVMSLIGDNNQLLADDRQSFVYDAEGNREKRFQTVGMAVDTYTWDHRNRLTSVSRSAPRESVQFDFESNNGDLIVDYLGNAGTGFLENGPLVVGTPTHGGHSMAVMLDGSNDFGNLGIQEVFRPQASGFTLSSWFYPQFKQSEMALLAFGGTAGNEVGYSLTMAGSASQSSPSQLSFTISDGMGTSQTVSYTHPASLLNGWHHLAITIDGEAANPRRLRMYVDSLLVGSANLTETVPFGDVLQPFVLGAKESGGASHFKGFLDDIRVVPSALDATPFPWMMQNPHPASVNTLQVDYTYDHNNRLISRTIDPDGQAGSAGPTVEYFIHDGVPSSPLAAKANGTSAASQLANPDAALVPSNLNEIGQIVLRLGATGQVRDRYLWGTLVDQLFAEESPPPSTSGPQAAGPIDWALADHLGTIRDLVRHDISANTVNTIEHRAYDSYGNVTSSTASSDSGQLSIGFTGRLHDPAISLQNNLNRWYDITVGRWVSEDPIGFSAGDWNLIAYVGSHPTAHTDPSGRAIWPILVHLAVEVVVLATWYGNFCGPGSGPGPGQGGPKPVDGLDEACLDHDRCYENGGDAWTSALPGCSTPNSEKCDKDLCQDARNFNCAQVPWPRRAHCYTYRAEITGYFC